MTGRPSVSGTSPSGQPIGRPDVRTIMATNTLNAETDLIIETDGSDTVLAVRFADAPSPRDARRLAQHLTTLRMPGVQGVDAVDDTVVASFDPGTITRSHLELLVHDAARHL